jgi:hypothetical protein
MWFHALMSTQADQTHAIEAPARAVEINRPRSSGPFSRFKRPVSGIRAPGNWRLRCWRAGKGGRPTMPGPASELLRRLQGATVLCRRCSSIIVACPHTAPGCGRCYTTLMVALRTGRHQPHGCSGEHFLTSLRACERRWIHCPCPGNAVRPWSSVIEDTKCPDLLIRNDNSSSPEG